MNFFMLFKSMQTGFALLLLMSLVASVVDLSNPTAAYYFFVFYALVTLFVINLAIYVVNKIVKIIQLLKMHIKDKNTIDHRLGLHIGLFAVHAGIAFIFLGNMLDLSLGYNQRVELRPGEHFTLPASDTIVKLEEFSIDYYQDGSPSQYISKVLVAAKDNKEEHYDITVNHPLEIAGTKTYQESYGWGMKIEIADSDSVKQFLVKPGDAVGQGGNSSKIEIIRYVPNFVPGKIREPNSTGYPAVIYFLPQKNVTGVVKLGERVKISDAEYLTFVDKQAFTVLKVKTSPGLPFVKIGGALMILGIVAVFVLKNKKDGYKDVSK